MSNLKNNQFYRSLGHLFYAIASADKKIRKEEIDTLNKTVKELWLSVDDYTDNFGTDSAYQIEVVFDWLLEEGVSSEDCFKNFKAFYEENTSLFNPKIKHLIIETADKIANSVAGRNKAELVVLANLSRLIQ